MPTYTFYGCTIEVAKGGQSAKATRHVDAEGKALQPPQTAEFQVISADDAPTPQVQAERWAKGKSVNPQRADNESMEGIFRKNLGMPPKEEPPQKLTKADAERVAKATIPKKKK